MLTKKIFKLHSKDSESQSVFKNMSKLATGAGIAKVASIITVPIITRIYLPEHLAILSVFSSIIMILMPIGSFLYSMAIPLPKSNGAAINLTYLICFLITCTTLLFFIIFGVWGDYIFSKLSMKELTEYWWLIPIAIAALNIYELLQSWTVREKSFKLLAKTKISQNISGSLTKIILGLIGLKPVGLLIGQIVTQCGGIISIYRSIRTNLKSGKNHVSKKRMIFLFKRYSQFPIYRLPAQFLLAFTMRAPLFYFAYKFGENKTGQLGVAITMLAVPLALFGNTTAQAFYGEISKFGNKNPEKIYNLTKEITKKLFLVSLIPFSALLFLAPILFKIFFGQNWSDSGTYASILAVYLLTQFIYSPIANGIFNVFENQKIVLYIKSIRTIMILLTFYICNLYNLDDKMTLLSYALIQSLQYGLATLVVFKIIKSKF